MLGMFQILHLDEISSGDHLPQVPLLGNQLSMCDAEKGENTERLPDHIIFLQENNHPSYVPRYKFIRSRDPGLNLSKATRYLPPCSLPRSSCPTSGTYGHLRAWRRLLAVFVTNRNHT